MSAMLELDVELMMGFISGGGTGRPPPPPLSISEDFSSSGFVSLIRFLSATEETFDYYEAQIRKQEVHSAFDFFFFFFSNSG